MFFKEEGLEINNFVNKKTIKEIIVFQYEDLILTLSDIYDYIKNKNTPFKIMIEKSLNLELNVFFIDDISFSFQINKVIGKDILRESINYKSDFGEYEFVAIKQFNLFLENYSLPKIKCNQTDERIEPTLLNLKIHLKHDDKIIEGFQYIYYEDEKNFINFFNNHKNEFIKKEFKTPLDFDKNFNYYFNIKGIINTKEKFYIYEGVEKNRRMLQMEILDNSKKQKRFIYYGIPGKGKSITLLGSLKYRYDFSQIRTLYINCKTIKNLLKDKKISIVKQIFIDEIIYLTAGNFQNYLKIVEHIKFFNFKNEYDFWTLINEIISDFCNDNLPYVFGFDQFNDSNDYYGYLNKLKVLYNKRNNFKFVIFSSMNESDIRKIKINNLFHNNPDSPDEKYIELDNICDIKEISRSLNFHQIEIWKKLGYTMKSLMELKNTQDLDAYLKEKKIKITYKIISFYSSEKEINNFYNKKKDEIKTLPSELVYKMLSFSTDYNYEREDILNIIDNIPFRYFNILKDKIIGYYKVVFGFPLVKEIMEYLYKFISFNYNYNSLKYALNNKGTGLATIFEMKVVFRLLPTKDKKNIFYNFAIDEHIIIESIVKREKETKKNKIQNLKNNTNYIIEQGNFGGKDLDCLIINMIDSTPFIYGFQISIYKPEIFTTSYLKDSFNNMIKNISKTFKIKIDENNTFFGYIFDYSRISDKNYPSMLNNCIKNKLKYCFFDTNEEIFRDLKGRVITDIDEITCCPFTNNQRNKNNLKNSDNNFIIDQFVKEIPSTSVLNKIISVLSKDLNIKINNLKYQGEQMGPKFSKSLINIKMIDSKDSILLGYLKNEILVTKIIKNNTIIDEKVKIEPEKFHIYEIE